MVRKRRKSEWNQTMKAYEILAKMQLNGNDAREGGQLPVENDVNLNGKESMKAFEIMANKQQDKQKGKQQPLYELSRTEIDLIRDNNIHLTDFSRKKNMEKHNGIFETSYDDIVEVGKNVRHEFHRQSETQSNCKFELSKVKKRYVTVTVTLTEKIKRDANLRIIGKEGTDVGLLLLGTYDEEIKTKEVVTKEICKKIQL